MPVHSWEEVCGVGYLEASTLSGTGLLLHGHDLHDLVLQHAPEEELHNLELLNGHREEEDVL